MFLTLNTDQLSGLLVPESQLEVSERFMKKIEPEMDDWLRPEYKRSDFGEFVRGKYASKQLEFADLVRLLLGCLGEDQNVQFERHSEGKYLAGHKLGDWTYEIDNGNRITLRYWLNEFRSLEESVANPGSVTTPQERSELENLLLDHIQSLKAKVSELED